MTITPGGGLKNCGRSSKGMYPCHSQSPAAPSAGTSPGAIRRPYRQPAGGVIADVAVDVGVDEILARSREARDGRGELGPVLRAVDVEEGKLETIRIGRGPAQRILLVFIAQKNRAVPGDPLIELQRLGAFDRDGVALQARLLQLSAKYVTAGLRVDLFAIQILHVELKIGHAPGDALVVPDDHGGNARQRHPADVQARARASAPCTTSTGMREFEMRIVREDRLAGGGVRARNRPRVRAGLHSAPLRCGNRKSTLARSPFSSMCSFDNFVAPAGGERAIHFAGPASSESRTLQGRGS